MQTTAAHHHQPEPELVHIKINGTRFEIVKGRHSVTAIKDWAEVPAADELEQVIHKTLHPLANDATVEIQGGEKFISHPADGGSS
jgi:hypothetical protein